jgi:hypothetical protein
MHVNTFHYYLILYVFCATMLHIKYLFYQPFAPCFYLLFIIAPFQFVPLSDYDYI